MVNFRNYSEIKLIKKNNLGQFRLLFNIKVFVSVFSLLTVLLQYWNNPSYFYLFLPW